MQTREIDGISASASGEAQAGLPLNVRVLPSGEAREGTLVSETAAILEFDLPGITYSLGTLLELESPAYYYLGELKGYRGAIAILRIEHRMELAKLRSIRQNWSSWL